MFCALLGCTAFDAVSYRNRLLLGLSSRYFSFYISPKCRLAGGFFQRHDAYLFFLVGVMRSATVVRITSGRPRLSNIASLRASSPCIRAWRSSIACVIGGAVRFCAGLAIGLAIGLTVGLGAGLGAEGFDGDRVILIGYLAIILRSHPRRGNSSPRVTSRSSSVNCVSAVLAGRYRVRECDRYGVGSVWRRQPARLHVFLAL